MKIWFLPLVTSLLCFLKYQTCFGNVSISVWCLEKWNLKQNENLGCPQFSSRMLARISNLNIWLLLTETQISKFYLQKIWIHYLEAIFSGFFIKRPAQMHKNYQNCIFFHSERRKKKIAFFCFTTFRVQSWIL